MSRDVLVCTRAAGAGVASPRETGRVGGREGGSSAVRPLGPAECHELNSVPQVLMLNSHTLPIRTRDLIRKQDRGRCNNPT